MFIHIIFFVDFNNILYIKILILFHEPLKCYIVDKTQYHKSLFMTITIYVYRQTKLYANKM